VALDAQEREAHRPADQQRVGELEKTFDHGDLVGHLGAAKHRDQGPRRIGEDRPQLRHLAFE